MKISSFTSKGKQQKKKKKNIQTCRIRSAWDPAGVFLAFSRPSPGRPTGSLRTGWSVAWSSSAVSLRFPCLFERGGSGGEDLTHRNVCFGDALPPKKWRETIRKPIWLYDLFMPCFGDFEAFEGHLRMEFDGLVSWRGSVSLASTSQRAAALSGVLSALFGGIPYIEGGVTRGLQPGGSWRFW